MKSRLLISASLVAAAAAILAGRSLAAQSDDRVDLRGFDWDHAVNLTNHGHWDFDPDFSPDGAKIAFHSNRPPAPGNRGQIYVMDADGNNPVALTHTEGTNYMARWSPDGTKIAFVSERDGNPEIYLMNPDGSGVVNLTNNPDGYDAGPDWSPDGRHLAYFAGTKRPETDEWQPPGSPYRYWDADLYILDMETGQRVRVTTSDRDDIYPTWSNDGTRLAFTSSRDGNEEIYVINADGSGERRLTETSVNDKAPSWLPGDSHLQFRNDAGEGDGDHSNLHVLELASGDVTQITDSPGVVYFAGTLAPDGDRYIFSAFTQDEDAFRGERADIYLVIPKGHR